MDNIIMFFLLSAAEEPAALLIFPRYFHEKVLKHQDAVLQFPDDTTCKKFNYRAAKDGHKLDEKLLRLYGIYKLRCILREGSGSAPILQNPFILSIPVYERRSCKYIQWTFEQKPFASNDPKSAQYCFVFKNTEECSQGIPRCAIFPKPILAQEEVTVVE